MSQVSLFEVVGADTESTSSLSPHVWKTKVDLGILGVDYKREHRSFHLIDTQLRKEANDPKLTVPALKVGDKYIKDSWVIAEYLDKTYGSADKTLFPGGAVGKSFIKFIELWVDGFADTIRPLAGPKNFQLLDAPSRQYKFGADHSGPEAALAKITNDKEFVESQLATARKSLKVIEDLLAYQKSQGQGLWIAGTPSHADALVFGWYGQSRVNNDVVKGVWEHSSLPNVVEWVKATKKFIDEKELIQGKP